MVHRTLPALLSIVLVAIACLPLAIPEGSSLVPVPAAAAAISRHMGQAQTQPGIQVGFSLRGAIHYGYYDILPFTQASHMDASLFEVRRMGGTVVRVFVGNHYITDEEAARRLGVFLDKAATYGISVIPSLIDFYHSGFNPSGTDGYYTDLWNAASPCSTAASSAAATGIGT